MISESPILPLTISSHSGEEGRSGDEPRRGYLAAKRVFDSAFAVLMLATLSPLIVVVVAAISWSSPGPVLFRQRRVGQDGRVFTLYKFRTMVADAHAHQSCLVALNEVEGPVFKMRCDPRVTRVGRWLRRTSIDELPQLLNILRGEMSVVGPRPPLPDEVAQYSTYEMGRLSVKPGLTCLWQVSGRSFIGFEEWVELDYEYIRRRSFWFDLRLIALTFPAVFSGRGAF